MKKLLGKKATFITCLVVAIVMLALVVFMCVRPVSSGLSYNGKSTEMGVTSKQSAKVLGNTITMKESSKENGKKNYTSMDMWVYRDGDDVLILGTKKVNKVIDAGENKTEETRKMYEDAHMLMDKDAYKAAAQAWKDQKKENRVAYTAALEAYPMHMEFSAFKLTVGDQTYTCTSAIILVVVFALVDAVAIAGTVGSIIVRKKKA